MTATTDSRRQQRLEEQRDELLAALDALDAELERGEIDEADHAELSDDLTRRAARVIRRIEDAGFADTPRRQADPRRVVLTSLAILALALGVGFAVASLSGIRLAGQGGTGDIDLSTRDLLLRADNLFGQGLFGDADAVLDDVFAVLPDDPDALTLRGRIRWEQQEAVEALQLYDQALAVDPTHVDALVAKAIVFLQLPADEFGPQAIELLDRAIAEDPPFFDPYMLRASLADRVEGDTALALELYAEVLDRGPPAAMVGVVEERIRELEAESG